MEPDLIAEEVPDTGSNDPASKEFRRLKREVGLMRIALERLADEPGKIVIPDYTETLVELTQRVNAVASRLKALRQAPALELTPETIAKQIADTGAIARSAEQAALAAVTSKLVATTRELLPYVEAARTERVQNFWLAAAMGLGLTLGLMMGLILPGPIHRAMPESWHWPERAAANILDRDMWDAGERLQAVADPKRWNERLAIEDATQESKDRVTACLKVMVRNQKPTVCKVVLKPRG
jgi:Family of unknown function (DUF6118)